MKIYKRILAGILALSMMTVLGACNNNGSNSAENENTESTSAENNTDTNDTTSSNDNGEETSVTEETQEDVTEETLIASNLDYTDEITDGVVMTVGGYDIGVEEYRYYFLNLKSTFDGGDDTYWDGETVEGTDENGNDISQTAEESKAQRLSDLKSYVNTFLINNYSIELLAKDNNISLTAEELAEVEETYNETKKSYESSGLEYDTFEDYLTSTYCSKELYMKSITRQALEEKVVRTLYEEDFRTNLLPEYNHCQHILFSTASLSNTVETEAVPDDATDEEKESINSKNAELIENAKAEVKATAEEVLQKIKDGADFEEMIAQYNEDPGESVADDGSVEGYYFKEGTMVSEFEDAFFALGDNEVSDIVETDYGYHIIKRLPITDDDAYINENIVSLIMQDSSTGETTEYYDKYMELADQYFDNMEITYGDNYVNINTKSLPAKSSAFPSVEAPTTENVE